MTDDGVEPALVPEFLVRDVVKSMDFWCGLCDFGVLYHRLEEGFAYLVRDSAHVMLEQAGVGRNWWTGPLQAPLGRGIHFQITVTDLEPLLTSLRHADWALFMNPEERWYRVAGGEAGVRQFLVSDPDGYLLRFQAPIGRR